MARVVEEEQRVRVGAGSGRRTVERGEDLRGTWLEEATAVPPSRRRHFVGDIETGEDRAVYGMPALAEASSLIVAEAAAVSPLRADAVGLERGVR
jgi:hypothetical protein